MLLWSGFILCSAIIVFCGYNLSKYGDIIAEKTGAGRTWIGVVLMATVTSLPELVTGVSSVTIANVPDIAVGDALGSCVFNMLILAVLDALYRPMPISTKAHHGHVLSAGSGILLLGIAGAGLFLGSRLAPIGWTGLYSLAIVPLYVVSMRLVFNYERRQVSAYLKERTEELKYGAVPLRSTLLLYGVNALAVVGAALFLPGLGSRIAAQTGLSQSFVGNIFIAMTTSLPEVVVSIAALRLDAVDLAIGNLFGSNIFNILILAIDDLLYVHGPLFSSSSGSHVITVLSGISMTAVAVIGLTYRAEKKALPLAWDSVGIIMIYITNLMLLYRAG
jgi:cation:H+ antiporter